MPPKKAAAAQVGAPLPTGSMLICPQRALLCLDHRQAQCRSLQLSGPACRNTIWAHRAHPPPLPLHRSQAEKKKAVEDKTFGLKNKSKSAKVQKYVQQVQKSAQGPVNARAEPTRKDKKRAEEERAKELAELFALTIKQPKVPPGQPALDGGCRTALQQHSCSCCVLPGRCWGLPDAPFLPVCG